MPFSDPMADGPAIQAAGLRALHAGQTLGKTLAIVKDFRDGDTETPIVLMGYYNPIYVYGVERFLADARRVGVDGLIVVDCPPEEDDELCLPTEKAGLSFIRLTTPTTDDARLGRILNTSGFIYYVSITGVTGAARPDPAKVSRAVQRIKGRTSLPVAVGFGVRDPDSAKIIGESADGVVVGTALVETVRHAIDEGQSADQMASSVASFVGALARACVRGVPEGKGASPQ